MVLWLDQDTGCDQELVHWALYVGHPLVLWNGLNVQNQFHHVAHCRTCDENEEITAALGP